MTTPSLLLVEDHPLLRSGLRMIVEKSQLFTIVGEAEDLATARTLFATHRPDAIVLDLHLPDGNGLELAREILPQAPHTSILVLSSDVSAASVIAAFETGIHGYVVKTGNLPEIERALTALAQGRSYLSPEVTAIALEQIRPPNAGKRQNKRLSPREMETLRLLVLGLRTKEVADKLGVELKTAETFRRRLMQKLQLGSVADLTRYAIRQGIVPP